MKCQHRMGEYQTAAASFGPRGGFESGDFFSVPWLILLFSEPTHGPGPGRRHGTSQRAPVAFTNTQPANTSAAPLNAAAGMAAVVALLSPLPLLQLPRRCLPLSHGRCQYYGHCENAGAVAGGWKMRRRVRSAGRVWMRGQGQRGVSVGESRSGEREGSE